MNQIFIKYNPYILNTEILINGRAVESDSALYKYTNDKRIQEWIGEFPEKLKGELNSRDFDVEFYGSKLDFDDVQYAFQGAKQAGIIGEFNLKFIEGKSNANMEKDIVDLFNDLTKGPIGDFRDPKLKNQFDKIHDNIFPVNVIATMSSGKSTLINALLSHRLMPSKNEACTATITEIMDNDGKGFTGAAYDDKGNEVASFDNLTYDNVKELNEREDVHRILIEGNIPFIDSKDSALQLVDTPGPNNSQNQVHKNITYGLVKSAANNLVLYVLDGEHLATNDDSKLLTFVAEQIQKGGKVTRDRFLFVVNKMDAYDPTEESINQTLDNAREYLSKHGIKDPQLFPCSADLALKIRTVLKDAEVTKETLYKLPTEALSPAATTLKFLEYDSLHLEKYSTLSPSAQSELMYHLAEAKERDDNKEQALIHSGIYSIEAAITAYVKKYAKTKKIKELAESFGAMMESNAILLKAKEQVANSEETAREVSERANAVRAMIASGEEARKFKERLNAYQPMDEIEKKAAELTDKVLKKASKFFAPYGDTIDNRIEAQRLIKSFSNTASDAIAELNAELDSVIHQKLFDTGSNLLSEYREKLARFDNSAGNTGLDFSTADLIKGALNNMQQNAESWGANAFVDSTVEEVGKTTVEEKKYYVKTGEREEEVADGTRQEQIGTKQELTGMKREYRGTRKVKREARGIWENIRSFFGKDYYEDEDVYENVPEYREVPVYQTVINYKKVKKAIYEERTERIEKFSVEVADLQSGLVAELRLNIEKGMTEAKKFAETEIANVRARFEELFKELDDKIKEKYEELEKFADEERMGKEALEENRRILDWIEDKRRRMDDILNI